MRPSILVTGASGNVGREVVAAARARGLAVTAAYRDPDRVRAAPDDVAVVRMDFGDPGTWAAAVRGQTHLFLLLPPAAASVRRALIPFVDEARRAGVDHVVFLSVAGAGENRFLPHRAVEDHLRRAGDRFTSLRPGFFAQNLQDAYRRDIVEDDRIYVPAGRAPVNWIDVRDVAEVAARVFDDPIPHRGQCYTLAGPGPVRWEEVAGALSAALSREIRYVPASIAGYVVHLFCRGLPLGAIAVQTVLHASLRFGRGADVDPTLERLLGRPGRSVETYIRDHAAVWKRETR